MNCAGEEADLPQEVRDLGPAPHLAGPGDEKPWIGSWRALEQLHKDGKIGAIGVSNFQTEELQELVKLASVRPALLQNSVWNVFMDPDLMRLVEAEGIMYQAYSVMNTFLLHFHADRHPEGSASRARVDKALSAVSSFGESLVDNGLDPLTPQQLVVAYLTSRGIGVIPRSANPDHIASNARAVGALDSLPARQVELGAILDEWLRATHGVPPAHTVHEGDL
jgi:diketogulonate reductase-like aldo/keto reductase